MCYLAGARETFFQARRNTVLPRGAPRPVKQLLTHQYLDKQIGGVVPFGSFLTLQPGFKEIQRPIAGGRSANLAESFVQFETRLLLGSSARPEA